MSEAFDLELIEVEKIFGSSHAVDRLSLQVSKGEFVSLLGPSGCGKSTTLLMISGFEDVSAGMIRVRGRRIDGLPPEDRRTGLVFQSYALFPHMTVFQNVEYGLRMRRVPKSERVPRARRALAMVHMDAFASRAPRQLSGGQQQRVALARALVTEPDILLLDEPFNALDRELREELQREVRALQRSLKITTIFVTHDQEEALLISDRIAVMQAGRMEQCATPQELYGHPVTEFVARFIGRGTFMEARVSGEAPGSIRVETSFGYALIPKPTVASPTGRVKLFFRPEHALLSDHPSGSEPARLCMRGAVRSIYFQGATSMAEIAVPSLEQVVLADASERLRKGGLAIDSPITVEIPGDRLHVFPMLP